MGASGSKIQTQQYAITYLSRYPNSYEYLLDYFYKECAKYFLYYEKEMINPDKNSIVHTYNIDTYINKFNFYKKEYNMVRLAITGTYFDDFDFFIKETDF